MKKVREFFREKGSIVCCCVICFVLLSGRLIPQIPELSCNDHTKVMRFVLEHQSDIVNWTKKNRFRSMPSNQSVMNFLKKIANNRSTYDVYLVLQKVIDINKRNRPKNYKKRIKKIIDPIIARINNAGNVQQIKAVLSKERIRFKSGDKRIARAIEISYKIVQDGIQNGIYSIGKLRRHSPSRGFWGDTVDAIKDTVADIVKNDAEGAIVGGAYGAAVGGVTGAGVLVTSTAGAVAGACEASSISTVGLIFDLVMHPSPAY